MAWTRIRSPWELARVSLWLATAASDHPLTFLNHRLVPGDSLLGITVDDLLRAFSGKKVKKALTGDDAPQNQLPFFFTRVELDSRLSRAFRHLHEIQRLEAEQPGDFEDQQLAWFTMRQELADFRDAHQLRIGRAFLEDTDPAADPLLANRWMQEIQDNHNVSEATRTATATAIAKGNEVRAFCWDLVFPELFFEPEPEGQGVRRRERPGFDAMVGNPPWDKIRPFQKEFFARYDPAIRDFQGQTLKSRVSQLAPPGSEALRLWDQYNDLATRLAHRLIDGGIYQHQVVLIGKEKAGGDPDLSKLFLERFHRLSRQGGRVAILMPGGLIALEGATGLRRLLFSQARLEAIYSFENWGKRFFPIHASFKFLTLIFEKLKTADQSFPAAFMLRDERFLALPEKDREAGSVRITSDFILVTSPEHSSIIELRDDREREFIERIYRRIPALASKDGRDNGWNVEIHRELDMTDDAWRFRNRKWLLDRGCRPQESTFVAPSEEWYQFRPDEFVPGIRYVVPDGTKYRITSVKPLEGQKRRGSRAQRLHSLSGFLLRSCADDENEMPVTPDAKYVGLYEGRMVHQFDNAAKAYVRGEGRSAEWLDLDLGQKGVLPHYFLDSRSYPASARACFCNITGQTNERSLLAALLPEGCPAGNKVPTIQTDSMDCHLVWICLANSLLVDFLIRQKISTTINFFYVETLPILRPQIDVPEFQKLSAHAARLVSITPEIQLAEPASTSVNAPDCARKSMPSSPASTTYRPPSLGTS